MNYDEKLGLNRLSAPIKIILVTLALFLMGLAGTMQVGMSQETLPDTPLSEPAEITFGTLPQRLDDVGCSFVHQEHNDNAYPVIVSGPNRIEIQMNGQTVLLESIDSEEFEEMLFKGQIEGDPVTIRMELGDGESTDGGANYEHVNLEATWRGVSETVEVKGYCGC